MNPFFEELPLGRRELLRALEERNKIFGQFRSLWHEAYLLSLRERGPGNIDSFSNKIRTNEIVTIKLPNKPRPEWAFGRVLELFHGNDGVVRSAKVLRGDGGEGIFSIKHLYPLELSLSEEDHLEDQLSGESEPDRELVSEDSLENYEAEAAIADDNKDLTAAVERDEEYVCPVCLSNDWAGTSAVCCDGCDRWHHFLCVGLTAEPTEEEEWFCAPCVSRHATSNYCLGLSNRSTLETLV